MAKGLHVKDLTGTVRKIIGLNVKDSGGTVRNIKTAYVKDSTGTLRQFWPELSPPQISVYPVISGGNEVGNTLSCSSGTWTGTAPFTYTYRWRRDGADISMSTNSTYTTTSADSGRSISCRVYATNSAGASSVVSSNSIQVAASLISDDIGLPFPSYTDEELRVGSNSGSLSAAIKIIYQTSGVVLVEEENDGNSSALWLSAGNSSDYSIKVDNVTGDSFDTGSSAVGVWLNLGTERYWQYSANISNGSGNAQKDTKGNWTFTVRNDSTGETKTKVNFKIQTYVERAI